MPGHTIKSIIRQYNNMIDDPVILEQLLHEFNNLNGAVVPRVGQSFKIPIHQP